MDRTDEREHRPMTQVDRPKRTELAHFLRSRRERVTPVQAGITVSSRRRAPGLLREEVAQLADVSVTWYTWLEQGRPVNVSAATLTNIARALRLSSDESTHLFTLADRPQRRDRGEDVPPELHRLLEGIGPNPAYLTNHCWDVVAANAALATGMFAIGRAAGAIETNLVVDMLTNPQRREEIVDWERHARRIVGAFRASHRRHRHDERFAPIVDRLLAESEPFCRWWNDHEIADQRPGTIELNHPRWGRIAYSFTSFRANRCRRIALDGVHTVHARSRG